MSTTRSVERSVAILQLVSESSGGIGVTAIAEELSLAKSTVSRLLSTMQAWQVVQRTEDNRFQIGSELFRWTANQQPRSLSQCAIPILHNIVKRTGETAAFCILDQDELLYQENIQSERDVQMRDWQGERVPAHTVSPGKVLLAYAEPALQQQLLSQPLAALTPSTITEPGVLREQLALISKNGYAIADEEYGEGIVGIAVPLVNRQEPSPNQVVAALCVYGPKFRLEGKKAQKKILEVLRKAQNSLEYPRPDYA